MRGGKRTGAGRKPIYPPVKKRCISMSDEHIKLLRMWGRGDVSAGLRWLIEAAAPMIHRESVNQQSNDPPAVGT